MATNHFRWLPLHGPWEVLAGDALRFHGLFPLNYGIALASTPMREGVVSVTVTVQEHVAEAPVGAGQPGPPMSAQIMIRYEPSGGIMPQLGRGLAVGLGGSAFCSAYVLSPPLGGGGWTPLQLTGEATNIELGRPYHLQLRLEGQVVRLFVDDVETVNVPLAQPLAGTGTGVFAQGVGTMMFEDFDVDASRLSGFAIMEFSGKFRALYTDVLQPVAYGLGIDLIRADEIPGPGFIISDIIRSLWESSVIVAEITKTNANVFFEVGYSYALGKPMILLAERGSQLPFDISGMRVIFYDDTIGGKARVEEEFARHLRAILI